MGKGQKAWDDQFRKGIWGKDTCSPHVMKRVSKLCNGGRLVEFGCGFGQLPRNLPRGTFSSYVGIDISDYAIREATKRAREAGVSGCDFFQGDMASWLSDSGVSLIVVLECLYYLSGKRLDEFLKRCCDSLTPQGAILVVVHSAGKHWKTLRACRRICKVIEEEQVGTRTFLTLTRPDEND